MFMKATEITPRIQDIAQLVWKRMLTVVFPLGLCVVVLGATDGEGTTGLLHRSPWQHVISHFGISVPYSSVVFFMPAHVVFLIASLHAIFIEHASELITAWPITGTFPVRVTVAQESCPGLLHSVDTLGLPHMVSMLPTAFRPLLKLLKFGSHW